VGDRAPARRDVGYQSSDARTIDAIMSIALPAPGWWCDPDNSADAALERYRRRLRDSASRSSSRLLFTNEGW